MIKARNMELTQVTVTVAQSATTGTATVPKNAKVIGAPNPQSNQDQFIDSCLISGTTLTITLASAATAANVFEVTVLV